MSDPSSILVSMNRLSTEQRAKIIGCLVEGNSIRATCRLTGAAKGTVTKLILDLGEACSAYQDKALRNLTCERVQVDEIWSFVGCKKKNFDPERHDVDWGDAWTFVAIDADTKLVPSWLVGQRNSDDAIIVLDDLRSRLATPVQLSTDGHSMYLTAVPATLGDDVDYGQVVKKYGRKPADSSQHRYGPERCLEIQIRKISGSPAPRTSRRLS